MYKGAYKMNGKELKECVEAIKKLKAANIISNDDYAYIVAKIISYQLNGAEKS